MFEPERPENKVNKFLKYFSLVMTLVYPAIGLYLFFSGPDQVNLDPAIKKILGLVLVFYGAIRFYRAYQQFFKHHDR